MKILFVATVGGFMPFFKEITKKLIAEGHKVDFAANQSSSKVPDYYRDWGCKVYDISCSRSPFSFGNIKAIKEIRSIAKDYDIVHCHTPLAGMATRLGCKKLRKKQGLKVLYTAHGFHFYKGSPKKNWIIYYPIEKICSKWTDVLITINSEDFELAKRNMKSKRVAYIPGVGIDIQKFANVNIDVNEKKKELGIAINSKIILSVGELNENKNHKIVIEALGKIADDSIHYIIAGVGNQREELINQAKKCGVNLHLLGYRKDVEELYKCCDLYIHPSFREGLPVALMEAIASKTNVICSKIRGCSDLVKTGLFIPSSSDDLKKNICDFLYNNKSNIQENYERLKSYEVSVVNQATIDLYIESITMN